MTILVPSLPPHTGGVADYAALLARYWPEPAEIGRWIVAEGGAASRAVFPDWNIVSVDELPGGWTEALASIGDDTLLVNYAQYGFSRAGMPFDLINALLKWRAGGSPNGGEEGARRLLVYFHETWLTGPLWRRRGLVAPVARFLARRLAGGADEVITNCELHAEQLQPAVGTLPSIVTVPANILPSLAALAAAQARRSGPLPAKLRVVIFGLPETRLNTLQRLGGFLIWLLATERLQELVLLGGSGSSDRFTRQETEWLAAHLNSAKVRRAAALSPEGISEELLAADLGLSAYSVATIGKSGTVAALQLHGCPVGYAGHSGEGRGWNLAIDVENREPVEWSLFLDAAERAVRESFMGGDLMQAGNWSTHALRLRAFV